MNTINKTQIKYSFECGVGSDIFNHYIVLYNGNVYEVFGADKVKGINKRHFKKLFGITWTEISKRFFRKSSDDYFIKVSSGTEFCPEDDSEDFGLYFENDHEQLIEDGCWAEEFMVIG